MKKIGLTNDSRKASTNSQSSDVMITDRDRMLSNDTYNEEKAATAYSRPRKTSLTSLMREKNDSPKKSSISDRPLKVSKTEIEEPQNLKV